jgi:hypothetical protein
MHNKMHFGLTTREKWEARLAIAFFAVMMLPASILQTVLNPDWDARLSALALLGILYFCTRNAAIMSANRKLQEFALLSRIAEEENTHHDN